MTSMAHTRATALALAGVCSMASCNLLDPCEESRDVEAMLEADLTATAAVDGLVSLIDSRDDVNDQLTWMIFFAPTDGADSLVTQVHLHDAQTDDVLYTFPVSLERADPANPDLLAWIASAFEESAYQGSEPIGRLYQLVIRNGTYVDVHTMAHPAGARSRLVVIQSTGWTQYCD